MFLENTLKTTKQELEKLGFVYSDGRTNNLKLIYHKPFQTKTGWNTACEIYFDKEACCIIGENAVFFFQDNEWNNELLKRVNYKLSKENK